MRPCGWGNYDGVRSLAVVLAGLVSVNGQMAIMPLVRAYLPACLPACLPWLCAAIGIGREEGRDRRRGRQREEERERERERERSVSVGRFPPCSGCCGKWHRRMGHVQPVVSVNCLV